MVTTTTFQAIRNNAYTKLKAITPSVRSDVLFLRSPMEYKEGLREFAERVGASAFRVVELAQDSEVDPEVCAPDAKRVTVTATLTIAYPNLPGVAGTGVLDDTNLTVLRDVIAADAKQVSDKLHSSTNYVAGQNPTTVVIGDLDRGNPLMWFQSFTLTFEFYKAQSLD